MHRTSNNLQNFSATSFPNSLWKFKTFSGKWLSKTGLSASFDGLFVNICKVMTFNVINVFSGFQTNYCHLCVVKPAFSLSRRFHPILGLELSIRRTWYQLNWNQISKGVDSSCCHIGFETFFPHHQIPKLSIKRCDLLLPPVPFVPSFHPSYRNQYFIEILICKFVDFRSSHFNEFFTIDIGKWTALKRHRQFVLRLVFVLTFCFEVCLHTCDVIGRN